MLTAGSSRVIDHAKQLAADEPLENGCLRALLLGLLAESECRAALMLAEQGIDEASLQGQCPAFQHVAEATGVRVVRPGWEAAIGGVIAAAQPLLVDFPRPLEISTEHLLYGLVAGEHELADWLVEQGLAPGKLRRQILQLHGYGAEPLECAELTDDAPSSEVHPANSSPPANSADTASAEPFAAPLASPPSDSAPRQQDVSVATLRVLDASANRAREALRVAEDYTRFVLNDRHLTERLKQLRHRLAAALATIEGPQRYACRDTPGDVGTELTTASERNRPDVDAVLTAACKRLGESLRSLEEFGKTVDDAFAASIERLRYDAYTVEAALHVTRGALARLSDARLYVLVDACATEASFVSLVEELVTAGVDVIQLRDKRLTDRELVERARRLCAMTAGSRTLAIINDRPDIAAAVGADGVHVGQDEMRVRDARAIVGAGALVGVSTHSLDDARRAALDGADYIGVGPTFPSTTKRFADYLGVPLVAAVAQEIRLPAFAIGGITTTNAAEVLATGIHGLAVAAAVTQARDPAIAVSELRALLGRFA
ncbi:MAG: thiamine phosphate synthase [Pirellulales bacterium]